MRQPPISDQDRERVRQLHARGMSRNDIAREIGRAAGTVTKIARQLGLSFDRTATKAATEAKVADARDRRANLAVALLADAERLREQLWRSCSIYNFGGRDNTYNEVLVVEPPFADKLKILQSVNIAVDKALRLDEYDSGNATVAGSLLGSLFASLQAKHGTGDE